jgi:hypothetical protein
MRNKRAWELAGRQHGIVARRQLLALGFNSREIEHRVGRGRLHVVMRGIYAVPGAPTLRKLLDALTFRLSDSDLEILFRPIAAAAELPPPLTKHMVNGWEVDFYWPDLGPGGRDRWLALSLAPSGLKIRKSSRWSTSWKRAPAGVRGQADQGRREPE